MGLNGQCASRCSARRRSFATSRYLRFENWFGSIDSTPHSTDSQQPTYWLSGHSDSGDPALRAAEWKRSVRPLLPSDQRWAFRQRLCYRLPIDWMLFGVLGEGSSYSTGVYIWAVRMPLFVPSDVVDLSWSERVAPATTYQPDASDFNPAVRRALYLSEPPADQLQPILDRRDPVNMRVVETRAYALLIHGDVGEAADELDRVARHRGRTAWEDELVARATDMLRLIREHGQGPALKRVRHWRDQTLAALGLQAGD